jgi:hypothetical protein
MKRKHKIFFLFLAVLAIFIGSSVTAKVSAVEYYSYTVYIRNSVTKQPIPNIHVGLLVTRMPLDSDLCDEGYTNSIGKIELDWSTWGVGLYIVEFMVNFYYPWDPSYERLDYYLSPHFSGRLIIYLDPV